MKHLDFLLLISLWDEFRQKIRKEFLGDGRRISFKDLRDRQRAKAIVPFLRASNTIPGLLMVFAIRKNLPNIFSEPCPDQDASVIELSHWNKASFSKLSRISILGALLVACMSAPNQNVLWFSDQDEIAPNESKIRDVTKIVAHYISHLCPHALQHIRFGTTGKASMVAGWEATLSRTGGARTGRFVMERQSAEDILGAVMAPCSFLYCNCA
jgi:hypothetical protein